MNARIRVVMVAVALMAAQIQAATRYVSPAGQNQFPYTNWTDAATTIQAAVDAASQGDTVLVTNGTYATGGRAVYGIMTNRVAVTSAIDVRSVNGAIVTFIVGKGVGSGGTNNGPGAVRGVYLATGASLTGFTVTIGHTLASPSDPDWYQGLCGGGVWCQAGAKVYNCIISDNACYGYGGGILRGEIFNSLIVGNQGGNEGGGAFQTVLYNCTVVKNISPLNAGGGGGGGVRWGSASNSIVYLNTHPADPSRANYYSTVFDHSCTAPLPGGGQENTAADPLFRSSSSGDYHLQTASPCIDKGTNQNWMTTALDLDGGFRIGGGRVDMGAYEYNPAPILSISPTNLTPVCYQGTNAVGAIVDVWNSGNGALDYTISDDVPWLSVSPTNGTSLGEHNPHAIVYNTSALSAGNYSGTIAVSDPGAIGSPQTVGVMLTIVPPVPILSISPSSLDFGSIATGSMAQSSFSISNAGITMLTGTMAVGAGPFGLPTNAFSLPDFGATNMWISFSPATAGPFSNDVVFTSNGGTAIRSVTGRGAMGAMLVTPPALDFGSVALGQTNSKSFLVVNLGEVALSGTAAITDGGTPFSIKTNGSFNVPPGQTGTVTVSFSPTAVVDCVSRVLFSGNGGDSTNQVTGVGRERQTLYVSPTGLGLPPFNSWTDAATNIQTALSAAASGSEIWVASGIYYPTNATAATAHFDLKSGVALYGGFLGTETMRNQRSPTNRSSILSGDIGVIGNDADNCNTVVVAPIGSDGAVIDGFTITKGRNPSGLGAGMLVNANIVVRHCTIQDNQGQNGAGVQNQSDSTFDGCIFRENIATSRGGGFETYLSSPTLVNCLFVGNSCNGAGGGCALYQRPLSVVNCTFVGNNSPVGSAIYNSNGAAPDIRNSIFWDSGDNGGGIYVKTEVSGLPQPVVNIRDSDVSGGFTPPTNQGLGLNIVDLDPAFASPAQNDFHLSVSSPCIDMGGSAGAPTDDLDGLPRPSGITLDLGAYEFQATGIYHTVTVTSVPSSVVVTADTRTGSTPCEFRVQEGLHEFGTSVRHEDSEAKTAYSFVSWSDGGAATHSIIVTQDLALAVSFNPTQYLLTASVAPNGAGSTAPAGSQWYDVGSPYFVVATAKNPWTFFQWTGDTAGSGVSGATIAGQMDRPRSLVAGFQKPDSAPWRFAVASDSAEDSSLLREIATAVAADGAEVFLQCGDLVSSPSLQNYQAWTNLMAPAIQAGVRVLPVRGNHDVAGNATPGWTNVFSYLPGNGPAGEAYFTYAFTNRNAVFIGLDEVTNQYRVNQPWLNAELATNTQLHVFAFGHYNAFQVSVQHPDCLDDYPTNRNAFWSSLAAAKVGAYFSGNDHFYDHARIDDGDGNPTNDVHQLIVGTEGASFYSDAGYVGNNSPWIPVRQFHTNATGYVLGEVEGDHVTLTWKRRAGAGIFVPGGDSWPPRSNQFINFPNPGNQFTDSQVYLAATANSGLPVSLDVASGPGLISDGTNLFFTGTGVVSVVATQPGNWSWAPAPPITNTFLVSKHVQFIIFPNPGDQFTTNQVYLTVTSSSGLPVSLDVASGPGLISDGTNLFFTGTGVVSVVATQPGNWSWAPAPPITNTFLVSKHVQFIIFPNPGDQFTTNQVYLTVTSSSGLPVSLDVASGPGLISDGTNLFFTGTGVVSVVATQPGDWSWTPAPPITRTFLVSKHVATLVLSGLNQAYDGTARSVGVTTTPPGLPVSQVYSGNGWAPTNAGTYMVMVIADSVAYHGEASVTLTVARASQTIQFPNPGDQAWSNTVHLSATASSGLPVSFVVISGPASIEGGSNLVFYGVSPVTVVATQNGDSNWNPAQHATNTFRALPPTVLYVSPSGLQAYPFDTWAKAATNVQAAVDLAVAGCRVLVAAGTYDQNSTTNYPPGTTVPCRLAVPGAISVIGVDGPEQTLIVGGGPPGPSAVRCVYLGSNAVIQGFTMINGNTDTTGDASKDRSGGGIWCEAGSVVSNCQITLCSAANNGGGVLSGRLSACTLTGNSASSYGGGVYAGILQNSLLINNQATVSGGGAYESQVMNCTLSGNSAFLGGGVFGGTVSNSIVYGNVGHGGNWNGGSIEHTCTMPLPPGGTGNITNDPHFINQAVGDYHLSGGSPCINAGTNQPWMTGATDLDGNLRIVGGVVDQGSYESTNGATTNGVAWGWLLAHGLPTDGSADDVDSDADGTMNWQEWVAGTDPTSSLSVLRFTSSGLAPSQGFVVRWPSVSNRFYDLRRATNLMEGTNAFAILPGASNIPATPTENTYTDSVQGVGSHYYRIDVRQ